MGININAQDNSDSDYVRSVKNMCRIVIERSMSPLQMYDILFPLTKNYYTQKKSLKILHKQTNEVIYARIKELENQKQLIMNGHDSKKKKPFLDLLLQTQIDGKPLTHEEIREEVDTFMFEVRFFCCGFFNRLSFLIAGPRYHSFCYKFYPLLLSQSS
jgi:cytochrome P450 family 4